MFVDINPNARPKEAKIHLAKPSKQIISHLHEKLNATLNVKYGNINELSFAIPFEIDGQYNDHVDMIKEKMLLKLTLGTYVEWYIVDEIEENGDEKDLFNVKAFSLGYQLSHYKAISSIDTVDTNEYYAEALLNNLLATTSWSVNKVDKIFNSPRSIDIQDDQNILDCILKMAETWNALIVWDTINKKISFVDIKTDGKYRGLTVKYGRLLNSIKRTRTTDEMVTRLYPYGNEGIGINSVNPTNKGYIENFSYFMYPFEREPSVRKQFTNILINSGFNDGLTGWNGGGVRTVSNGILTATATAQFNGVTQYFSSPVNYANHKIYVGCNFKADNTNIRFYLYDGVSYSVLNHSGDNQFKYLSFIKTVASTPTTMKFSVEDARTSAWTTFYIDNTIMIDLTAIYGVGKEPSQSAMDELIARYGWFDGTINIETNLNIYNTLKSSAFMSDDLAHALLDSSQRTDAYSLQIKKLLYGSDLTGEQDGLLFKNKLLVDAKSDLTELQNQLQTQKDSFDTANLANNDDWKSTATSEITRLTSEISTKQSEINSLESYLNTNGSELTALQTNMSFEKCIQDRFPNNTTKLNELKRELQDYIIEKDWRDDSYIDEKDLYDGALEKFYELQQPKIVVEVNIDNLLDVIDEQYFWDKLTLGDLIKVKYPQMHIDFMAKIVEMKYDLTNMEIQLTVSNSKDLLNDSERFMQMLYANSSASTSVNSNKHKWNKIDTIKDETLNTMGFIENEWDLTKTRMNASVDNSVSIGGRGIIVTDPNSPNDILVIQSGQIALTKDNGQNWKTAITPSGIVAEQLIGKIVAGQNLYITNNNNTFTIDDDGAVFEGDSFKIKMSGVSKNINDVFNDYLDVAINDTDSNLNSVFLTTSELKQEADNITASFSASGGTNILVNSVGWKNIKMSNEENTKTYADANINDLSKRNWFVTDGLSRISSVQNDTMQSLGFGSGIQFNSSTTVNTATLEQYIPVLPNTTYTISWFIDYESVGISDIFEIFVKEYKSNGTGSKLDIISYGVDDINRNIIRSGNISTGNAGYYYSSSNESVKGYESQYISFRTGAGVEKLHLVLSAQNNCLVTVTGLMMSIGLTPIQWTLATGELYNTNIRQDVSGIRVSNFDSNGDEINYTQITPDKFSGYYQDEEVFMLDKDETTTKKFRAKEEITMGSIRILDINDTGKKGWAFIPIPRID